MASYTIAIMMCCCSQTIPTTQPVSDVPYFRELEAGGTVVFIQRRENTAYDVLSGRWWESGWYDSFVWKPGHAVVPVYGWECKYVTQDGRWIVLHRHGNKPKIQSVSSLMQNARQVTFLQADLTRDGRVDQADYGVLQTQMGRVGPLSGDLNKDGWVDSADFELFDLVRQQMGR